MKTLTVRGLDEAIYDQFARRAREQHRNPEAHARHLIEREATGQPLETCGELLDWVESQRTPEVNETLLAQFEAGRKRRSPRG